MSTDLKDAEHNFLHEFHALQLRLVAGLPSRREAREQDYSKRVYLVFETLSGPLSVQPPRLMLRVWSRLKHSRQMDHPILISFPYSFKFCHSRNNYFDFVGRRLYVDNNDVKTCV